MPRIRRASINQSDALTARASAKARNKKTGAKAFTTKDTKDTKEKRRKNNAMLPHAFLRVLRGEGLLWLGQVCSSSFVVNAFALTRPSTSRRAGYDIKH
jgi:hypothetical protein